MFRNLYDGDVTTLSPQGRLFQVEYAMEAVKQGAASIGVCSRTHVVLCALKRTPGGLASYQRKLLAIDDHMGIAISGLTSDSRVLSRYMQTQALNSRMNSNRPIPVQRLVADISDKAQTLTQQYGGRPFGVGLLVAGVDESGTHLFEFGPSGDFCEYHAMAIGARSQSARTFLDRFVLELPDEFALRALRDTLPPDSDPGLTGQNTSIGYLGVGLPFTLVEDEAVIQDHLDRLPSLPQRQEANAAAVVADAEETAMVDEDPAA